MYRQALLNRRDWLTIRPIVASGTEIDVENLYVELFLRSNDDTRVNMEGPGAVLEREASRTIAATHYVTAESLLARTSGRTVIVGPPGSGKTTLMKWICAYLLKQRTASEVTPIPVGLRDFAESLHAGRTPGLAEYALSTILGKAKAAAHVRALTEAWDGLRVIYLLDGWDEVPSALRSEVLIEIDSAAADLPVIITSRVTAAASLTRYSQTPVFELGPIADSAVAELCIRYGEARDRVNLIPGLLELVENSPSLWSLAGNPYLLTLFCELVFVAPDLPKATEVSPIWVLSRAIDLIQSDYNASNQRDPLTRKDMGRIEQLAHALSFDGGSKRTNFEPDADLGLQHSQFSDSPVGRSRFFNATGITSTSFSFVHLRMQEFLAARWIVRDGAGSRASWLNGHLLSHTWREEARFAAARILSSDESIPSAFRAALRALALKPDLAGESIRCVASILAAAGIHDGGMLALEIDLRAILWKRINSDSFFLNEDTQSLLEIDPGYLVDNLLDLEKPDDRLLEHLYRFLPVGLRQSRLDPRLATSPMLSWVIGLPGHGFPTRESLQAVGDIATSDAAPMAERIRALRDLGSVRAQSQVERLVPLLDVANDDLSTTTAETLGKIGGQRAAMALASALISLQESQVRQSPGLAGALLNALMVEGYGAIEPHSRDLLVAHINTATISGATLDLTLDALAGMPLPQPPHRILDILADQTAGQESLRKAAANVLRGISDFSFLNRALQLLKTEPNRQVRTRILSSLPFVPVNHQDSHQLWQLCRSRSTTEANLAVRLVLRTVARYPNHPLAKPLFELVENTLGRIASNKPGPLDLQILRGVNTIPPSGHIKTMLLQILENSILDVDILTRTAEVLAIQRLTATDLNSIEKQFKKALRLGKKGGTLVAQLAVILVRHQPGSAHRLLRNLARRQKSLGVTPRETLVKAAQRLGYLIFDDHVIAPNGQVWRAKKDSPRA